jgi:hypothetical protein
MVPRSLCANEAAAQARKSEVTNIRRTELPPL